MSDAAATKPIETNAPAHGARPLAGALWMVATGVLFVGVTATVKLGGSHMPAVEAAFWRYVLGLAFLVPLVGQLRHTRLTSRQWRLVTTRGVVHSFGVTLWFFAMAQIPMSEVTAMNYLNPVYVTLAAALFLGETLALRRILAVVAALVGAILILRPGFREIMPGHYAMLLAAVFLAASYLIAKMLADEINPAIVVLMLSVTVTIGLAPVAASVWVAPTLSQIGWLTLTGAFATAGHFTMTLAFRAAPLTVTQPLTFLQLIWATATGAIFFGEPVDGWVMAGGAVIIASVSFITWREAVLKRRAVTPLTHATKV